MRFYLPAFGLILASTAVAGEVAAPVSSRGGLQVTAYADGMALIKETRAVQLAAGRSEVAIEGVAPRLLPASVVVTAKDAEINAVRYDSQLLTGAALLERHLGKAVTVIRSNPQTGAETVEAATLLAVDGGSPVLRIGDRIEVGAPGRIAYSDVPAGLRARPTLVVDIDAGGSGRRDIDIGYLAPGVDWAADYVVFLDASGERANLVGRAIVTNRSGTDFPDATLSLVAGQINRATPPMPIPRAARSEAMMAAAPATPQRQEVGDVYLYTLPKPVSLADQEIRQVPLLAAADIKVTVDYVSTRSLSPLVAGEEQERSNPDVRISFVNAAGTPPGVPLPAGIARVYTADDRGVSRLLGEDRLRATPVGERVAIEPGKAFDITVSRRQTAYARIDPQGNVVEAAYEATVRNARSRPAAVRIVEDIPGDWQMLQESAPHEQLSANRIAWPLTVPAGGNVELTYRIRVRQ